MDTLLLSRSCVRECLDMNTAMDVIERVYNGHTEGQVEMGPKSVLDLRPRGIPAWTNATPSYFAPTEASGLKWAGGYSDNPKKGLPYMLALIVLQDPATGVPLAVMDGTEITAIKTGATAGLCAKVFAGTGPHDLALIGAGTQGTSCARGISAAVDLRSVRIMDAVEGVAEKASAGLREELQLDVRPCGTVEGAVRGASLIVTATQADEPLVMNEWVAAGATALSIGSWQEFDPEFVLSASKILVDTWEHCLHRGELVKLIRSGKITQESIYALINEVVSGRKPARDSAEERILVVPMGMGTHDVALGRAAYDIARRRGMGTPFSFM